MRVNIISFRILIMFLFIFACGDDGGGSSPYDPTAMINGIYFTQTPGQILANEDSYKFQINWDNLVNASKDDYHNSFVWTISIGGVVLYFTTTTEDYIIVDKIQADYLANYGFDVNVKLTLKQPQPGPITEDRRFAKVEDIGYGDDIKTVFTGILSFKSEEGAKHIVSGTLSISTLIYEKSLSVSDNGSGGMSGGMWVYFADDTSEYITMEGNIDYTTGSYTVTYSVAPDWVSVTAAYDFIKSVTTQPDLKPTELTEQFYPIKWTGFAVSDEADKYTRLNDFYGLSSVFSSGDSVYWTDRGDVTHQNFVSYSWGGERFLY